MAGTLVRVEGVRPSAGIRYFPALRRAWDSRHIIPRPGYAFPVRARIQAGAVPAERCCVRRSAGTHDKHTAMRRKSFAYRRIV
nr:MAG TPA: hypothetical protein [Caudoviricetes sp.]